MTDRTYHVLSTGLLIPHTADAHRVGYRGQTFFVTPEQYEQSLDRHGISWLDMDADAQIRRWGEEKFRPGPAAADMAENWGDDDTTVIAARRERERQAANKLDDPQARFEALNAINARYGAQMSSFTISKTEG